MVTLSNALTRAGHGLTLAEKRIVMLAVSKLDTRYEPSPRNDYTTKFTVAEYCKAFDVDSNTAYEQLAAAGPAIMKRSISFYEPYYSRKGKPLPPTIVHMNWALLSKYQTGEGWLEIAWNHKLLPHLMGLKKQFTRYKLEQATALRSQYSWKLLELLMQFESTGFSEFSIEDFATSMEATEQQKKNFAAIRRCIIEPAVKELREKDGWLIEWTPKKRGRKVVALQFRFARNPQGQLL